MQASLVEFHQLVQEISWVQESVTPTPTRTPTPMGSAVKPICPPHLWWGDIIIPNLQLLGFFSKGLKNEFETAVVNEPSVFEPLTVHCSLVVRMSRRLCVELIVQAVLGLSFLPLFSSLKTLPRTKSYFMWLSL